MSTVGRAKFSSTLAAQIPLFMPDVVYSGTRRRPPYSHQWDLFAVHRSRYGNDGDTYQPTCQDIALETSKWPLGVDVVSGIADIMALDSIMVKPSEEVHLYEMEQLCGAASREPLVVDTPY